ncbi:thermonuclease family protein [uncultured Bdellovibrio sp.]|uniref:thermonuclease family protein n=1 Tax=Bdellovibrio sp. HCB-162 TaxID=3394234 RepID=UPI0025F07795|nr:thermonuclease family protein [uncultured Bdellovibrio sp.]
MNQHLRFILPLVFLFTACTESTQARTESSSTNCVHDDTTFRCVKVLKNYDGDTLTVNIPDVPALIGKNISVRVYGIDTPEVKTKNRCEKEAGRIARNLVATTLKNAKTVELHNVQRDKYFRILADVMVDGRSLKDILLKNNLAYSYDGGTKQHLDWCKVLRQPASK